MVKGSKVREHFAKISRQFIFYDIISIGIIYFLIQNPSVNVFTFAKYLYFYLVIFLGHNYLAHFFLSVNRIVVQKTKRWNKKY